MKVRIINKSKNKLPHYETQGSAGMDMRADLEESIFLKPMERKLIPTGIFMEIPVGFEAQIRPRSGLSLKRGLTCVNSPGTIDSDYRGEIKVIMINLSTETQEITHGERVAQMVIAKYERAEWEEVNELSSTERGAGGFGSTGVS